MGGDSMKGRVRKGIAAQVAQAHLAHGAEHAQRRQVVLLDRILAEPAFQPTKTTQRVNMVKRLKFFCAVPGTYPLIATHFINARMAVGAV